MLKKRKRFFLSLLFSSLLLGTLSIFSNPISAAEPFSDKAVAIFKDKYDVIENKICIITTSVPIDTSCLKDAITVTDPKGNKINVSFSTDNDDKWIIVKPPEKGYKNGQTYTVTVSENLRSRDKKYSLKHHAQMNFTINGMYLNEIDLTKDSEISKANNLFSFNLMKQLKENDPEKNIVISPFSISSILALTQNGASGKTKEEVLNTMGFEKGDSKDLNENYKNIFGYYNNLKTGSVQVANSIWLNKGLEPNKEFIGISKKYYDSQVSSLDFEDKDTVKTINDWASKTTNGQIKEMIKEINKDALAILTNSIHFKGKWREEFSPQNTQPKEFTLSNGKKIEVPMMKDKRHVPYLKENNFSAITLSYYDGIEMNLFLPDKNVNINKLMNNMNKENLNKWIDKLKYTEVICSIPKFKINCDEDLKDSLKSLGIKSMFDLKNCDLSKVTNKPLYIDSISHKTSINIDEEGTEASAITVEVGNGAAAPSDAPPEFTVDRPFLFTIRDSKTGLILFMGKVENPMQ